MADRRTNIQAWKSDRDFCTTTETGERLRWGTLCSEHDFDGFQVIKVLNATCGGQCNGQGGPAEWLTVIDGEVVGSEETKRRAKLIGDAIRDGHIESTGDTGARLEGYLVSMAIWDYEGEPPTDEQRREIDHILRD